MELNAQKFLAIFQEAGEISEFAWQLCAWMQISYKIVANWLTWFKGATVSTVEFSYSFITIQTLLVQYNEIA